MERNFKMSAFLLISNLQISRILTVGGSELLWGQIAVAEAKRHGEKIY